MSDGEVDEESRGVGVNGHPPASVCIGGGTDNATFTTKDGSFLTCGLCRRRYVDPAVLPCLHTFCRPCLDDYIPAESLSVACPGCRQQSILPEEGVAGLQSNFFVLNLIDALDGTSGGTGRTSTTTNDPPPPCEHCAAAGVTGTLTAPAAVAAVARCTDCGGVALCESCATAHRATGAAGVDVNASSTSSVASVTSPATAHRIVRIQSLRLSARDSDDVSGACNKTDDVNASGTFRSDDVSGR